MLRKKGWGGYLALEKGPFHFYSFFFFFSEFSPPKKLAADFFFFFFFFFFLRFDRRFFLLFLCVSPSFPLPFFSSLPRIFSV